MRAPYLLNGVSRRKQTGAAWCAREKPRTPGSAGVGGKWRMGHLDSLVRLLPCQVVPYLVPGPLRGEAGGKGQKSIHRPPCRETLPTIRNAADKGRAAGLGSEIPAPPASQLGDRCIVAGETTCNTRLRLLIMMRHPRSVVF
ncbi:hypothetical protein NDU88_006754 [Pleurodeles waltl]|uniref:Uncharacterized protein n=1 Tax=Pleurodeles waltl TaxID=8319 RepID=A0AAV7NW07_PLEWA|nr:hypothetical protein NDU88_006754 [Pleurodeles waltl]